MRVAVYYNNRDIRIEERAVPRIGPGELLVRIHASGICGSDVIEWYRIRKAPLVLGHEIAGEIVGVGSSVARYKPGDRIVAAHHVPCNTCRSCLKGQHTVCETLRSTNFDPGGFAEYVRLPSINTDRGVFPIPDGLSYEEASFTEPAACVLRGQRVAGVQPGDTVLVMGSGMAGLLHIQIARAIGAGCVVATDVNPARLSAAEAFGAEAVVDGRSDVLSELRRVNQGRRADKVLVCTAAKSANIQAMDLVEAGGTILFFGLADPGTTLPVPMDALFSRQITLTTSYAGSPADHVTAMELIRAGRIRARDMITHRLGLAETQKGFDLVAKAQDSLKVIIEPQR